MLPAYVAEVRAHDATRLPHLYSATEIDELFPTIAAAPDVPNTDDYDPDAVPGRPRRGYISVQVDPLRRRGLRTGNG